MRWEAIGAVGQAFLTPVQLENLKSDVRRWGLTRVVFIRVMRRIENVFRFRTFVIHARTLNPDVVPDHVPPGSSARLLTAPELLGFARDPTLGMTDESIRVSCDRGDVCFGYVEGQEL